MDLYSEAFNPGFVDVVDAQTGLAVGSVAITYELRACSLIIPLALLGGDDGNTNYGAIVGDYYDSSDEITNFGLPPAYSQQESQQVVPEPSSCIVWSIVIAGVIVTVRRTRRVTGNLKRPRIDRSASP